MFPRTMLPAKYRDMAFIAGGYAACPQLATDLDVWVQVCSSQEGNVQTSLLSTAREEILAYLEDEFFPYEPEEASIRFGDPEKERYPACVMKVARIKSAMLSHTMHIMVTAGNALEVISEFDISTHAIALTMAGVVKAPGWTPINVPPVALKMTPSTPERMTKIATRFGHPSPYSITEPR